jgi:prepilin-type N-terminal cleavage/methylation domain-containing protein
MRRKNMRRRGFTLIETAFASLVLGLGVLAGTQLLGALTTHTRWAARQTTAYYLANNLAELCNEIEFADPLAPTHIGAEPGETLSGIEANATAFNDLDDFVGSYNPPIDAARRRLTDLADYTQIFAVAEVDPRKPTVALAGSGLRRVTVTVVYRGTTLHKLTWLRGK